MSVAHIAVTIDHRLKAFPFARFSDFADKQAVLDHGLMASSRKIATHTAINDFQLPAAVQLRIRRRTLLADRGEENLRQVAQFGFADAVDVGEFRRRLRLAMRHLLQ